MALWAYVLVFPDGREEERVLAAGNLTAARARAEAHALNHGARLKGDLELRHATRGSM